MVVVVSKLKNISPVAVSKKKRKYYTKFGRDEEVDPLFSDSEKPKRRRYSSKESALAYLQDLLDYVRSFIEQGVSKNGVFYMRLDSTKMLEDIRSKLIPYFQSRLTKRGRPFLDKDSLPFYVSVVPEPGNEASWEQFIKEFWMVLVDMFYRFVRKMISYSRKQRGDLDPRKYFAFQTEDGKVIVGGLKNFLTKMFGSFFPFFLYFLLWGIIRVIERDEVLVLFGEGGLERLFEVMNGAWREDLGLSEEAIW